VRFLNELEWIDGRIWANVYTTDMIVIINPSSGKVEGVIDCSGLLPAKSRKPNTDVLNGIAVLGKRVFVTGKNWPKLFEIELIAK
jgi:glutamine cyclotransferase